MVSGKYTIILDTNILGNYKNGNLNVLNFKYVEINKNVFESLIKFIQNNKLLKDVEIAFSKISIEEIKHQQNKIFAGKKEKLIKIMEELSPVGESKTDLQKIDYLKYLSEKSKAFVGKYDIKLLDYPPDSCFKKLIDKVINHKKPFYKKNFDSGFKDALIWESIIQYAKEEPNREYILLTTDTDFSNELIEEFESETDSDITIKSNVLDVKKFLVEKANLKIEFDKMSKIYLDNFKTIEDEVNKKFKVISVEGNDFNVEKISLDKDLFDLDFKGEEYGLTITGDIFYSGMAFGFDFVEGDVDWHMKQDVEPDLFHVFLKKERGSYKIISVENTASNLK